MRLINTKTEELEEFFGDMIPSYATLSHCWGSDEVSLKDMNTPSREKKVDWRKKKAGWKMKAGYTKINYAIHQADIDHFSYLWVDTCCIDQSSSAELSEAINSMYRWYEKSGVCYAYLEDVQDPPLKSIAAGKRFSDSRWFTRGWTLQELVAPNRVEFFGSGWTHLGNKENLNECVAEITRIPVRVLNSPREIRFQSVARRMSWASRRQTTRLEDMAYCLLGIFGINMPLMYGEGEKAFQRLQVELIKETDDQTIFAWDSNSFSLSGVFARSPANFETASEFVPIRDTSEIDSLPYTMTNRGLHIQLPMVLLSSYYYRDMFYGILNCRSQLDFSSRLGIPLLNTTNPSLFKRTALHGPLAFTQEEISKAELRTLYIENSTLDKRNQPIQHICRIESDILKQLGYKLTAIVPSDHSYDGKINTMSLVTDPRLKYDGLHDDHGTAQSARIVAALEYCDKDGKRPIKLVVAVIVHTKCPDDGQATASAAVFNISKDKPLKEWFEQFRSGELGTGSAEIDFPSLCEKYTSASGLMATRVSVNLKVSVRKENLVSVSMFVVEMNGRSSELREDE